MCAVTARPATAVQVRHPKALVEAFPKIKDRLADEDQGVLNATVRARVASDLHLLLLVFGRRW